MKSSYRSISTLFLTAAVLLAAVILCLPPYPLVDESVHFLQAQMFAHGNWTIHPFLATWPTMNLLVSASLKIFGTDALIAARATIAFCAFVGAIGFYQVGCHFDSQTATMRTGQFFLLPIVLPYCGLVYTDIPALAALLWLLYSVVKQRPILFCVTGLLAVALRQSNIVWLLAAAAMYFYEARDRGGTSKTLPSIAVFSATVGLLWLIVVWNVGGVALTSATQASHFMKLRGLPNIEFAIGLGGFLFLPILASSVPRLTASSKHLRWIIALTILTAFVGLTFLVKHSDNTDPGVIDYFLHNWVLYEITDSTLLWVFALCVAGFAIAFAYFPLHSEVAPVKIPLFAVAAIYLLPFWLIEPRYYIPLYALFSLFRQRVSMPLEWLQLVLGFCLSVGVLYAISVMGKFL
jgi:alpha-1,2-glucosyltransferase